MAKKPKPSGSFNPDSQRNQSKPRKRVRRYLRTEKKRRDFIDGHCDNFLVWLARKRAKGDRNE